jgi:hypothetical protein
MTAYITDLQNSKIGKACTNKRVSERVGRVCLTWFCRNGIHDCLEVKMWCNEANLMVGQKLRKSVSWALVSWQVSRK